MKRRSSLLLAALGIVILGGCATTKIDLYRYKDVSSVTVVDEGKSAFQVRRPRLDPGIGVDPGRWPEFEGAMRDYFLAYNDQSRVFELDPNGSHRLKLTLHNVSMTKKFTPPKYVEKKRKVKTDKGVLIKDESYYTDPYWSYGVETAIVAELSAAEGKKRFYESGYTLSYSQTGKYPADVPRSRYIESLQGSLERLHRQIANEVAPEGLIVSKKVAIDDEDDWIFMVNMGHTEGLREKQKLLIFKEIVFKDEIEAKTMMNKVRVGTATVSDQIMPHYAWVRMDDSDYNRIIEVGDIVQPRY